MWRRWMGGSLCSRRRRERVRKEMRCIVLGSVLQRNNLKIVKASFGPHRICQTEETCCPRLRNPIDQALAQLLASEQRRPCANEIISQHALRVREQTAACVAERLKNWRGAGSGDVRPVRRGWAREQGLAVGGLGCALREALRPSLPSVQAQEKLCILDDWTSQSQAQER